MQSWIVTFCVVGLSAIIVTSRADPVKVSSPPDRRTPPPDPAAVREGALMFPHDRLKQGEVVALKDLIKKSISNLQELVDEEDAHLDTRISKGLARLNERLEEGDDHLKEELDEDVARMKERMTKVLNYMKELLIEGDEKTDGEVTKLKEAFGKRQEDDVKQLITAMMDDVKQQMTIFEAGLKSTKDQLEATQRELKAHQETLLSTRADLVDTKENLQSTREQLHEEQQASTALKAQLQIRTLKVEMNSVQSDPNLVSAEIGSIFTRWGRATCPDNTSLVYSGYVGGQYFTDKGGASNYLCLVRNPSLDSMHPPEDYNLLHGTEYQRVDDLQDQVAVCSVCRATQVMTIMIPATIHCPLGWTTQYRGHLASSSNTVAADHRTEFVCLDRVREYREGGQADRNGALFALVLTHCGSLPCPPYVDRKVVTCVVCSL